MPVKKGRKAPRRKLSTRFKQEPIRTAKTEWNKIGTVGKIAIVSVVAGATSLQASRAIDGLPIVGPFLSALTSFGARIRTPRQ